MTIARRNLPSIINEMCSPLGKSSYDGPGVNNRNNEWT